MTERLHFRFSLSCIGEGNGTPLQCSCLENPRDGGAWWAVISGVAQSRTRLKRLSSRHSVFGFLSKIARGKWTGVGAGKGVPETIILDLVLSDQIKMSTARG